MEFNLSEDYKNIQEMAASFSETELMPFASEWDQKEIFPIAVMISSLLQTTLSTHVSGVERVAIKFTIQHKK